MPGWLWIVVVPFGFIVLVWLDRVLSGRWLRSDVRLNQHAGNATSRRRLVYLPGILVDGDKSSSPVLGHWLLQGDVTTVSYDGGSFKAAKVVTIVGMDILLDHRHDRITLIGSSMGGLLAMDIVNWLRRRHYSMSAIDIVFVDAPSGAKDMLGGGNIAAPAMRLLPFGRMFSWVARPLMKVMLVPPRDRNIESHDKESIKRQALANMAGYPLSIWRDQLAYMAGHRPLQSESFEGLGRLVYLRCDRDNETVAQPQAADSWRQASGDRIEVVGVDSTHCGYLERPSTWRTAFRQVLASGQ